MKVGLIATVYRSGHKVLTELAPDAAGQNIHTGRVS
jgi:hypothetical protein